MCFTDYQSLLLQPIILPKWFKISKVFSWRTQERKVLFLITTGLQKYTNCGPCQKFTEVWIIDTSEHGISELPFCLCIKTSLSEKPFIWKWVPLQPHFHANQTYFQSRDLVQELVLKQKHEVTRKWPFYLIALGMSYLLSSLLIYEDIGAYIIAQSITETVIGRRSLKCTLSLGGQCWI